MKQYKKNAFNIKPTIIICAIITIVFFSYFNYTYSYWTNTTDNTKQKVLSLSTGTFSSVFEFDCNYANLVINTEFYDKYMTLSDNNTYEWKKNENNDILYRDEINSLTPINTIIKNDYCYIVVISDYSLIDTGIPSISNPNHWQTLQPLTINYLNNWVYKKNHIVKTEDGKYYQAKWFTSSNPNTDRTAWNKIEKPLLKDFYTFENTQFVNYANPILDNIKRSYFWDAHTLYKVDDVVKYNNIKYICTKDNEGNTPADTLHWAWKIL